ncbi:MAG: YlbF family regulator [Clostridia bacterium]|nr:YlbF family regulator [Clostridia bacterium]
MIEVIERSRALGEAIVASDAFKAMQLAESEAESDPAAVQMESTLEGLTAQLRQTMDEESRDEIARQMDDLRQALSELPVIRQRDDARADFSRLMEQVNNILQFTITGEISALSRCSGNCSGCAGCH